MIERARFKRLEKIAKQIERQTNPAPRVVLTMPDGERTDPLLWSDAMSVILSDPVAGVECTDPDIEGLLIALASSEVKR